MSAEIDTGRRDHGAGRGETCARLQVRLRGAGAGPLRRVLRQRRSPVLTRSRERRSRRGSPAPGGGRPGRRP